MLLGEIIDDPESIKKMMGEERDNKAKYRGLYFSKQGKPYLVGVIDPLTGFNIQKHFEYGFKRIKYDHEMSCVPPRIYADRFKEFVRRSFCVARLPNPLLQSNRS